MVKAEVSVKHSDTKERAWSSGEWRSLLLTVFVEIQTAIYKSESMIEMKKHGTLIIRNS